MEKPLSRKFYTFCVFSHYISLKLQKFTSIIFSWHGDFSCGKNVERERERSGRSLPIWNRIFLHEFSAQSTIIIVIYMKEAINAPIVESLLSNQDKIPSLL